MKRRDTEFAEIRSEKQIPRYARDDNFGVGLGGCEVAGCSREIPFDTVAGRSETMGGSGNGEADGDSERVAGDFGLSDLQDARQTYPGQFRVEVCDLPAGLSGA